MGITVIASLTIITLIAFLSVKKRLHLFEILFIWMISIYIEYNVFTLVGFNLGYISVFPRMDNYTALFIQRMVLMPTLTVWFVHYHFRLAAFLSRAAALLLMTALMVGLEYLGVALRIFQFVDWRLWWSIAEWTAFLLFIIIVSRWFRRILQKEVQIP